MNFVAAMVAAVAVVFAVFAWRLSAGPVSLAFLTPYMAAALEQTDSPIQLEFSDTILTWAGWERALDIRILDVRARGADGEVVATAPEISISLSVPALWRGMVAPTVLEIIEPSVRLVRNADGSFEFGLGDVDRRKILDDASGTLNLLFADLLAPPNRSRAMGYLERISVLRGNLAVIDHSLDMAWTAPLATINITRNETGIGIDASLLVDIGGRASPVDIRTRYRGQGRDFKVWVDFSEVRPEWLALEAPGLEALSAGGFPVNGAIEISFDAEANLTEIAFNLGAEAGQLYLDEWFTDPIEMTGAEVAGSYVMANESLRIASGSIDLGGPKIVFDGVVEGFGPDPFIAAGITVTNLSGDEIARYWPATLAPDVRDWVIRNISGGLITTSRTSLHLKPGDLSLPRLPDAAVRTTLEFEDATLNYYDPLPKVTGVSGFGTITGRNFDMRLWGGTVEGLAMREARIVIEDLSVRDDTTITVEAEGPIAAALRYLAHPLLDYPRKLGLDPGSVTGDVRASLGFSFPITYRLKPEDVVITAASTLTNVRVAGLFDGIDIGGGPLALTVDAAGMDLAGPITLGVASGEGTWRENFTTDAPFKRRLTFAGRLTDTQRLALGLPGSDYITGPTDIAIEVSGQADGRFLWRVDAGLDDARIRIPELYWEKLAGVGGLLELRLQSGPGIPLSIDFFTLAAGDLIAQGRADIDSDTGALVRLDLDRLAFGETDVRAALVVDTNGGYRMTIKGPSLDLRPYLEDDSEDDELPDMSIAATIERVMTRDDQFLTAVEAKLLAKGGNWEAARIDGLLASGKGLAMGIRRENDQRYFWMKSDDGGEVLRALDVFDDAIGGELTLLAALDGPNGNSDAIDGELRMRNFSLRKVPILARLLTIATLTGVFDLLSGEGLPLSRLVVPFTKRGKLLEIRDARAFGPAIGFTFKGVIDQQAETADLDGTLVPAYALNSIFGKILILGDLLVGGEEDGGVFAMNYKLSGPLDDPVVTINPLSVLAPGFLRGLFSADIENPDSQDPSVDTIR
jgi:hypothetical protein